MKKVLLFALMVLMVTGAIFAGGQTETGPKPESEWKIALVPKDSTNAWFVRMEVGVKEFAADTGLNAFQKGPAKTDAAMQVQVIQDLIAQGVDALCVVPVDPAALEPVLGEALEKGIVVVTHEASFQENTMYDIEAFSNEDYGAFIMDNLAKAMGEEGLYTTMVGHVTNASHNEWADGGVAHQAKAYPNMTLMAEEPRVESEDNMERAYEKAKELFKKYPDLKGIMGTSSKDAPGVSRAIEELGLKDKVFVAGTGLVSECGPFLENGILQYITLWDPKDAGYAMCSLAVKILRGEEIGNGLDLGLEGYDNMQFAPGSNKVLIGSGWIVMNKENMMDYNF
ncbi:MAG: autoinducer 2 ABC transporter substrate-binding protein [Spirochaetales bacterium]|nr:autoinducer 2 ABC transporter substrate-binding protein [Spirochaetales bacterium]